MTKRTENGRYEGDDEKWDEIGRQMGRKRVSLWTTKEKWEKRRLARKVSPEKPEKWVKRQTSHEAP